MPRHYHGRPPPVDNVPAENTFDQHRVSPQVVAYEERVAFLTVDCHMQDAEAKRQALHEEIDRLLADLPDGIVGELIAADRRRNHPEVEAALSALGLLGKRASAWGFGHIMPEGRTYRSSPAGEFGHAAIIVPSTADGAVVDLVAQDLTTNQLHLRLDVAAVVGEDEIERARVAGRPLLIFASVAAWLRAGTRGAVVVDWRRAGAALDGVPAILAPVGLLERIAKATRDCHPRPIVAAPHKPGVPHAA